MKTFAYLDDENYCSYIINKENDDDGFGILIENFDKNYINRKYDLINKKWLDEYKQINIANNELQPPTIQEQMQVQLEYMTCLLELQNGI